jgi:hypothetical protein
MYRRSLLPLLIAVVCFSPQRVLAQTLDAKPAPPWRLAVRGGWWDVGVDATSPQGLFLSVGVPWVLCLPILNYSGQQGLLAADASAGYGYAVSNRTSLYGKLLTVWSYDWGDPCGDGCTTHTHRLYFFPVAGARHRFGRAAANKPVVSGAMIGLDLALAVWSVHRSDDDDAGWRLKNIPVWAGVAFSQVYAGYEW